MNIELDDLQLKAIEEMHNGCILCGGVGSGKSRTSLAYFFTRVAKGRIRVNGEGDFEAPTRPRRVIVLTTAKKRDTLEWEKEGSDFALSPDPEKSIAGIELTVDSWNNILKYVDVKDAFFIFDEQRLVGSGAWVKAFYKIARHNKWVVLSATPGDVWMDYLPVFVANGFYKSKSEFIERHVVYSPFTNFPKVQRYLDTGHLLRLRQQVLVEMPVPRHTKRILHEVNVPYDLEKFNRVLNDRWHVYEERPLRDIAELFLVARKTVNDNPARLEKVREILRKHPRLIVFYNFNYELDRLRTLATLEGIDVAEWNGQKHEPVPKGDSWIYLVQYTAGAEGWNCVDTDAEVFYSLNYSYKINEQSKGRIDRRNTKYTDLHYYILSTNSMIDKAIQKALKEKKNFNEKKAGPKFGAFGEERMEPDELELEYAQAA